MLERDVEKILRNDIKKLEGLALKFVSPGRRGVPDRIIVLEDGNVIFVELKRENGKLSALQKSIIRKLKLLNQKVTVVYGVKGAKNFYNFLKSVKVGNRYNLERLADEYR